MTGTPGNNTPFRKTHPVDTPRYRDRIALNDRVWLQIVGPNQPGIYYLAQS